MANENPTVGQPKPVNTTLPARLRRKVPAPALQTLPTLSAAPVVDPQPVGPFFAYEFLYRTEHGNEVRVLSESASDVPEIPQGCYRNITRRDELDNYVPLEMKFATKAERDAALG